MLYYIMLFNILYIIFSNANGVETYSSYESNEWKTIKSRNIYNEKEGVERAHFMTHTKLLHMDIINTTKYYVDIGTSSFMTTPSNALDWDLNFSGICVEPNLKFMDIIIKKRSCKGVSNPISNIMNELVYFKSGNEETSEIMSNSQSSNYTKDQLKVHKIRLVNTVTLDAMLNHFKASRVIDMLIIHCSTKLKIIQSLNTSQYMFNTIFIHQPNREMHQVLVNQGYWFLDKFSRNGECIYIHYSIDNFELLMELRITVLEDNDYYTNWHKTQHLYLLYPKWEKNLKFFKTYISTTTTISEIDE